MKHCQVCCQVGKMEEIYQNADFQSSSNNTCSHSKGKERDATPSKGTKVFLCLSCFCCWGSLCSGGPIADQQNWSKSRDVCVSKEADLVTITSRKEQDFLVSKIEETHWIGLNDLETEGRWVWVNNQTLKETGVEFWYKRESGPNEPDNWKVRDPSGENCASLGDRSGNLHTWFDGSCKQQKKFICEKKY